jgi:hypothetical protein
MSSSQPEDSTCPMSSLIDQGCGDDAHIVTFSHISIISILELGFTYHRNGPKTTAVNEANHANFLTEYIALMLLRCGKWGDGKSAARRQDVARRQKTNLQKKNIIPYR